MTTRYDVLIIGGGVVGSAIARELSRFQLKIGVVDKELDVGFGTSCRNSGVIHSGIHYIPGSLRAILSVRGNILMDGVCQDLKIKLQRIGKLTLAVDDEDKVMLALLKHQGEINGVPGLELIDRAKIKQLQPGIHGLSALHSPSSAIISPYSLTIRLCENAVHNGVNIHLGQKVTTITPTADQLWQVETSSGKKYVTKLIINSAGLYSAEICRLVGINEYTVYPCRGEYYVLDKRLHGILGKLVYPAPKKNAPGLGIHATPTVNGKILIGPSAEYLHAPDDYASTSEMIKILRSKAQLFIPDIDETDYIRNFSGIRPKLVPSEIGGNKDFIIEDRKDVKGFINLIGIESPGLTSAPAIAEMVKEMVENHLTLIPDPTFDPVTIGSTLFFSELPAEEKADLISKNPNYGEIICRCEKITKQEILEAINNPLGARTLSSIKYRARATMGRCQGGFCIPRIVKILRDEFDFRPEDYLLHSKNSSLFKSYATESTKV